MLVEEIKTTAKLAKFVLKKFQKANNKKLLRQIFINEFEKVYKEYWFLWDDNATRAYQNITEVIYKIIVHPRADKQKLFVLWR